MTRRDDPSLPRTSLVWGAVSRCLQTALIGTISGYRYMVSPLLPPSCKYIPTCSAYAQQAIRTHGSARGSWMAARRICRCHPWVEGGFDPVPDSPQKPRD